MFRQTVLATTLVVALTPPGAHAAPALPPPLAGLPASAPATAPDNADLAQIRAQLQQMKQEYEARIQALEKRLLASESATARTDAPAAAQSFAIDRQPVPVAAMAAPTASTAGFNPAVSLILGGTYANLSQDPNRYRLHGFMPAGDGVGPGRRGFNLGESELTLAAAIDPRFAGQLTFSLDAENAVSVEEAFFRTQGLENGLSLKAGRFLSGVGYLNGQHAHTWDFVDAPLAYQAFFNRQYKPDGVQLRWLAPTEKFIEFGLELGRGSSFPGNDRNRNGVGSTALFAHLGDDIGESASYRAGLSYLRTSAAQREFTDVDNTGAAVTNGFTGRSSVWIADGVYKWSPNGNPVQTNLKLQGEYFRRTERGTVAQDIDAQGVGAAAGSYRAAQSGWYLQGIYQFTAGWRAGLRYDRLQSGSSVFGSGLAASDFSQLATYDPRRATVMLDYSPSEFSRFRLQFAQDRTRPQATDNQIFLQYIMSLGAHGAHTF
ncbi:MAG: hypothetical protein H7234_06930 [Herminiimonas sp.]|nr:hypothetical protein [Herminiimonas sp.]